MCRMYLAMGLEAIGEMRTRSGPRDMERGIAIGVQQPFLQRDMIAA